MNSTTRRYSRCCFEHGRMMTEDGQMSVKRGEAHWGVCSRCGEDAEMLTQEEFDKEKDNANVSR